MGGLGNGSVGVSTTGNATGDTATLNQVNLVLEIFTKNLQSILDDFKVGSFNEISTNAALNVMEKASILIGKQIRNRSQAYQKARTLGRIFQELVSGWKQTVALNDSLTAAIINEGILQNEIDEATEILNNRDLLTDYLHQKSKQYAIFPTLQVNSIAAALKPEYIVYIQIWGYPPNGVWDTEKLSNIILDIQLGILDASGSRLGANQTVSGYTKPSANFT
jgi:hypothetical protein